MSFVKFKKEPQISEVPQVAAANNSLHIRIDVAPIPLGASKEIPLEAREKQTMALNMLRKEGKDLFLQNNTIVSNTAGDRLYQTKDLYGQNISVEKLIPKLTADHLTLRVNAIRDGIHSQSTCMELKTGVLADLLEESPDKNNEKTTQLELTSSQGKGQMFVTIKKHKGQHYINKVDYKISSLHDNLLHV